MEKIYFIADTHFFDDTILRYENRPFKTVSEMNLEMISRWNSFIYPEDSVYILGDFCKVGYESEILTSLYGKKYLVKGNHDIQSNSYYRTAGFQEVYDKPILFEKFWILSHEPLYVNENMPYANIFGHVHNSPIYKTYSRQHYCVSAERLNYMPISFEEIFHKITHE